MEKNYLGYQAKDKVTGFKGVIVGCADYLTGCRQYALQPKGKGDDIPKVHWFDEGKLEMGKSKFKKSDLVAKDNGCDIEPPSM
jgi:hypothetical protein